MEMIKPLLYTIMCISICVAIGTIANTNMRRLTDTYVPPTPTYYCFPKDMQLERITSPMLSDTLMATLSTIGAKPCTHYQNASILFFTKFDDIHKLTTIDIPSTCKFIYGLVSIDIFANKANIARIVGSRFPSHIPHTWILQDEKDHANLLATGFDEDGTPLYPLILKRNVQKQNGLQFINHVSDLKASNFVVCQRVLGNPLLVNTRKINVRIYLLVICRMNDVSMHMFEDGFLYYTRKPFSNTDISFDTQITTGYMQRDVYKDNPLTLGDLYAFLGKKQGSTLKTNIVSMMKDAATAFLPHVDMHTHPQCHFAILGADVAVDAHFRTKLMEINKGPDLNHKDDRDRNLKKQMMLEAFRLCKVHPKGNHHGFIHLKSKYR